MFIFHCSCFPYPVILFHEWNLLVQTLYFLFIVQLRLIVIIHWQVLGRQPVERVTCGYLSWEYRAFEPVSTHHLTDITISIFPISQSEAVSTVSISQDIKSLTWYGYHIMLIWHKISQKDKNIYINDIFLIETDKTWLTWTSYLPK